VGVDLDSGATRSLWADGAELPPAGRLESNVAADVCVIGAGIAGLTTAHLLAREGAKVVVIDDGPFCGGETGRTTAHLSNEIDDSYQETDALHGHDGARLAAESHTAAIAMIERIIQEGDIDCDFVRLDGYLFNPVDGDASYIDKEFEAAQRAGLNPERLPHAPSAISDRRLPSFSESRQISRSQVSQRRHRCHSTERLRTVYFNQSYRNLRWACMGAYRNRSYH